MHLRTLQLADRFRDLGKIGYFKKVFEIVEVAEETILTGVRGDIREEEIRDLLFPPSWMELNGGSTRRTINGS